MEILTTNLTSNGENIGTVDATRTCIAELIGKIKRHQERVQKHIEENYVEFIPKQSFYDHCLQECNTLVQEARHVLMDAGFDANAAIRNANAELVALVNELHKVTLGLRVTYRILKVDDLFQSIEEANVTKEYTMVLDLLGKLQRLVACDSLEDSTSAEVRVFQKCDCYQNIKVKYHIQAHILQQNLQHRFERLVKFTEKQYPHNKCVTLKISKDVNTLQETVMALFQANYNPKKMSEFLLENCFQPLITKPVSIQFNEDQENYVKLTISYALNDLGVASLRPSYKQVFEHIKMLLHSLANINVSVSEQQYVFNIIGDHIKHQLLDLLVSECLMYAIPETMDEFEDSHVVEDVLQFEHLLADVFLINIETDHALSNFCEKFESYFRCRFSRKLLDSAKEMMQKDLQDMTIIADKNTQEDLDNNPLLFSSCMVSRSTLEIIKLLDRILRQPSEVDSSAEGSYPSVVASIIHAYVNEVPSVHEKLLKVIPQQAALFHNNCLLLSHWVAKNTDTSTTTFGALVKTLQTTGSEYLNFQVTNQNEILMSILKDIDLTDPHTIGATPQKLIRQCMRQLDVLSNVWKNVLPDKVYNATFCNLLQIFCSEIIKRILAMEDISAKVASELSELIDIILSKTPALLKDEEQQAIAVHIPCWMKLEQLKFILMASLQEITDEWCDGVGILTVKYTAEEVRHLIRALFQNTDRRATALKKIC